MEYICCHCKRKKSNSGWVKQKADPAQRHSHGYCPECFQAMMEKIEGHVGMDKAIAESCVVSL
ncbi:MAG: hypothetical protein KJ950_11760 [Proteobacteria bacterium]|nr:hypothetical protein [Pseudomonadota bacterium]MBU1688017.1 hypothetical protein [Pseudomonadota bacterium]